MSGREHAHPTWGTCLCGHDATEHLWTTGMRVDYQGECMHRPCECETFHATPAEGRPKDLGHSAYVVLGS